MRPENGAREVDMVPIRTSTAVIATKNCSAFPRVGRPRHAPCDGMNLVAGYVAAQDPEDPGVLIPSSFARRCNCRMQS